MKLWQLIQILNQALEQAPMAEVLAIADGKKGANEIVRSDCIFMAKDGNIYFAGLDNKIYHNSHRSQEAPDATVAPFWKTPSE